MPNQEQALALLRSQDAEEIREGAYLAGNERMLEAVPALIGHLQSQNRGVQDAVDYALRKIGGSPVVKAVIPLLYSEEAPVRNLSMDILRSLGHEDLPALTALLRDDDPDIRIFASDILGSVNSTLAVPMLCEALLHDPEVNVRYQAAISLGVLGRSEAASCLGKALYDEEWVQFAVIEALSKLRADSALPALLGALDKSSDLVAASIIDALGTMGNIKAVPLLLKRLENAPVPLCNIIVKAIVNILGERSLALLGAKEVERLRHYLLIALGDEDTEVQDAAVKGLAVVGGERAAELIIQLAAGLNADSDMERIDFMVEALAKIGMNQAVEDAISSQNEGATKVAIAALSRMVGVNKFDLLSRLFWKSPRNIQRILIYELAKLGAAQDQPFFLRVLESMTDGNILRGALSFLEHTGVAQGAEDLVLDLLIHPYDDVKESALITCVAMRSPKIIRHLKQMLHSQDAEQRMMGVYALGKIDALEYSELLSARLQDGSVQVRRIAIEMLSRDLSASGELAKKIEEQFSDTNQEVRIAVIEALGNMENEQAHSLLLKGLKDEEPWVRIRCIEKLAQQKASWGVEKLIQTLDSETNSLVVIKAVEALGAIGGELAFGALLRHLNSNDPDVQHAAETALEIIRKQSGE